MMRMVWMSARLGMAIRFSSCLVPLASRPFLLHQPDEFIEEVRHLARAGGSFGVALETVRGLVGELDPLQRTVEERAVRRLHVRGERFLVDREAVVLAGDEDLAAREFLHGMVRAMVAELHLH